MKNTLTEAFRKIQSYVRAHKILSLCLALVLIGGGYFSITSATSTKNEIQYIVANATNGTLITSVSGTGQVSALNQIDLKPKASGDVVYVGVTAGQEVKAGTTIISLNATEAKKAVRDAQLNLDNAKLSVQKIEEPADALSLTQAQDALTEAQQSKTKDVDDLQTAYDNAYTAISNTFLDLPTVMSGLQDTLYKINQNSSQDNISYYYDIIKNYDDANNALIYKNSAATDYSTARAQYDKNFEDYKIINRTSTNDAIESNIHETYGTANAISQAIKSEANFLSYVKDHLTEHNTTVPAQISTQITTLGTYTNTINSDLSSLNSAILAIKNAKDAITSAEISIKEKTQSLAKIQSGTDPLDIQTTQLSLIQRENALQDARDTLANYTVSAPFDGKIAAVNSKKGDSVSSGNTVATLITNQSLAAISMNEIDIAKIKVGQKANLTFDAIDGLSISGSVAEIDAIGTVSQGVVTYSVKLSFDTQDDRVKPGMSITAHIITDVKTNTIIVPNSAVKTINGQSYVQVFSTPLVQNTAGTGAIASPVAPENIPVTIGISNNTSTEILSGISEGTQIVTRTITATTAAKAATPSLLNTVGGSRGTGVTGNTFRASTRNVGQ